MTTSPTPSALSDIGSEVDRMSLTSIGSQGSDNLCPCGVVREGATWIECSRGDQCPYARWYHTGCAGLGETSVATVQALQWQCPLCTAEQLQGRFRTRADVHDIPRLRIPDHRVGNIGPAPWMRQWLDAARNYVSAYKHHPGRYSRYRQCSQSHGRHRPMYDPQLVDRLQEVTDDAAIVWAKEDGCFSATPMVAVLQGPFGATPEQRRPLENHLRQWHLGPKTFRPLDTDVKNIRALHNRPPHTYGTQAFFHGGVWVRRGQGYRVPIPTQDHVDGCGLPFTSYLRLYERLGLIRLFGEIRYLLDAREYAESLELIAALPPLARACVADDDGACTHVINFDVVADCHIDCQDRGWVVEVVLGDFEPNWLCFPTLGVKVRTVPGTIIAARAGELEHFSTDFAPRPANTTPSHRYVHTNHIQWGVWDAWRHHGASWKVFDTLSDPGVDHDALFRALRAANPTTNHPLPMTYRSIDRTLPVREEDDGEGGPRDCAGPVQHDPAIGSSRG